MVRKRDEDIKRFIQEVGILFDARAATLEVNLKAYIRAELKASEERIKSELRKELASKDDIKNMVTKQDITILTRRVEKIETIVAGQKPIN